MKNGLFGLLGRYRDLLLAIALFIVIDLGVLIFNYQSSRLLESDTGRINRAGEMRMFSQQLAKAILTLRQEQADGLPVQTSLAQISESYLAHEEALAALAGELSGARGEMFDDPAQIGRARQLLDEVRKTWTPLAEAVAPIVAAAGTEIPGETLEIAANKAIARNIRLMRQADDLAGHLEGMAVTRAHQMRQIQLLAILLALANFAFIVFKFLRNLGASDRLAAEAREETGRILGTVREGLFLLGRDGGIGRQQSASAQRLLGDGLAPGVNFFEFLGTRMPAGDGDAARQFISLLFNERVKPKLMRQLNPLRQVEFSRGEGATRYLDFEFQQVLRAGAVEFLLVAVSDITDRVLLERELAGAEQRAKSGVEALLAILDQDPAALAAFLEETGERLQGINGALQQVAPAPAAYRQLIEWIARTVHGIKGESAALGLQALEQAAHAFEEVLAPLRAAGGEISGDQLIPVAVAMNGMQEELAKLGQVVGRIRRFAAGGTAEAALAEVQRQAERLALRVAADLDKQVRLEWQAPDIELPPPLLGGLRELLPQLLRNAVAHGIESAEERLRSGKPAAGTIRCSLELGADGRLVVAVEDDGRGLDPHVLRQQAIAKGLKSALEVAQMSDEEVAGLIFLPGFSSLDAAGLHAGRGDGLGVVKEVAERLGARLRISSRPHCYTRFAIFFRDARWQFA